MKITKSQLRTLIRESVEEVKKEKLKEQSKDKRETAYTLVNTDDQLLKRWDGKNNFVWDKRAYSLVDIHHEDDIVLFKTVEEAEKAEEIFDRQQTANRSKDKKVVDILSLVKVTGWQVD